MSKAATTTVLETAKSTAVDYFGRQARTRRCDDDAIWSFVDDIGFDNIDVDVRDIAAGLTMPPKDHQLGPRIRC